MECFFTAALLNSPCSPFSCGSHSIGRGGEGVYRIAGKMGGAFYLAILEILSQAAYLLKMIHNCTYVL